MIFSKFGLCCFIDAYNCLNSYAHKMFSTPNRVGSPDYHFAIAIFLHFWSMATGQQVIDIMDVFLLDLCFFRLWFRYELRYIELSAKGFVSLHVYELRQPWRYIYSDMHLSETLYWNRHWHVCVQVDQAHPTFDQLLYVCWTWRFDSSGRDSCGWLNGIIEAEYQQILHKRVSRLASMLRVRLSFMWTLRWTQGDYVCVASLRYATCAFLSSWIPIFKSAFANVFEILSFEISICGGYNTVLAVHK